VLKPKAQDNGDTKIKIFMILKLKIENYFRQICLLFVTNLIYIYTGRPLSTGNIRYLALSRVRPTKYSQIVLLYIIFNIIFSSLM